MLALLLLCAIPADPTLKLPPPTPDAANLCGVYVVVPRPGDGTRGTATISKAGDLYYVQWARISETDKGVSVTTMQGVGIRSGDALAVSWREGNVQGVTLYRVDGKRLVGRWVASPGDGEAQSETLQWLGRVPRVD